MNLGVLLRHRRESHNLSARQLSLAAGLSESVVGKVESGSIQPSLRVFAAIVTTLELNPYEIAYLVRLESQRGHRDMPGPDGR